MIVQPSILNNVSGTVMNNAFDFDRLQSFMYAGFKIYLNDKPTF